jgi:hypothetical protein
MTPISATVLPLPTNGPHETADPLADPTVDFSVEFLRRLAAMMSGGHNAEMLLGAADTLEKLRRRAADAERLCEARSSELAHCVALREIAEGEADDLMAEVGALKEQLEHTADEAERSRIRFADETLRLHALAEDSHARLLALIAEREMLQASAIVAERTLVATQMQTLLVARAQFDMLADGLAKHGDVVAQTIATIGGCAVDQALVGGTQAPRPVHSDLNDVLNPG